MEFKRVVGRGCNIFHYLRIMVLNLEKNWGYLSRSIDGNMLSNVEHMALSEKRKRKTMDGGRAITFSTHFGGCGTYSNLPLCPLFTQLHSCAAESLFPHLYYLFGLLTLQLINQQWPFFPGSFTFGLFTPCCVTCYLPQMLQSEVMCY